MPQRSCNQRKLEDSLKMITNCPGCLVPKSGIGIKTRTGHLDSCKNCGTLWRESGAEFLEYGQEYFKNRGHEGENPVMRKSKIATFDYFYRQANIPPGSKVLEVGCATGWGLVAGRELGYRMRGLDVAEESRQYAIQRGFQPETVVKSLAELANERFSLVAFFDALEHIPEPENFLKELSRHLNPGAKLLVVIPRADTASRKILGKLWPHYLADHWVHFSRQGLASLMNRAGFAPERYFFPVKWITPFTMATHFSLHSGYEIPVPPWPMFPLNFGEDGAVFCAGC
jgi:SAM-dependent methyltransferase